MKRISKIFLGFGAIVVFLCIVLLIISLVILKGYTADYAGSIHVSGIDSGINIYRDSSAVVYIDAQTESDAMFALGFVHAQERLFQMDLARRAGEGRLAEILGKEAVVFDKMFKTMGIYHSVINSIDKLNPETKKILSAYSDGVNEYIRTRAGNYSLEFDVLGYEPYEWKPEHSLLIAKMMAYELNISWWTDIAFSKLVQKFGEDKAAEILPTYDENSPTIIPKHLVSTGKLPVDFVETNKKFREYFGINGTHIGSNNWVVNSQKSESGKPIIANDPHLAFSLPGRWLVAVIRSDKMNVDGFTIPGLPCVVIGKNQNISWVLTNAMADDADFYTEQLDSTGRKYLVDGTWKNLNFVTDTVFIKGEKPEILEIKNTHRGPIISDVHTYNILFPDSLEETAPVSMRWTALDFSDEVFAIYSVNTAKNWDEFSNALEYFTVPGQNFVYGDALGNIGYICAAKLPIRNFNSPTLIYDGRNSQSDWKGYVPYNQMPKIYNPRQNYIASANNKAIDNFPYHISNIWEPPARIERITELLTSKQKHGVNDFLKYQMDVKSKYAEKIVPYVLAAFSNTKIKDDNLNLVLKLFENWDFNFLKSSQVPTIYAVFYQKLLENILLDEMGESLFNQYVFIANVPYNTIPKLLKDNNSQWFDNINTSKIENRDDIIRQSLVDALAELEKNFSRDPSGWQWENLHTLTLQHAFGRASDFLDKILSVGPFEIGGDGTTLFNTEYSFTSPFKVKLGASMRFIYDFASPDEFYFVLPGGQSGHFMSDHYSDLTLDWLEGRMRKVETKKENFTNAGFDLLKLMPNKVN